LKSPSQKRAGGVTQGVGPEFRPQYWKREKSQIRKLVITNFFSGLRINLYERTCKVINIKLYLLINLTNH
jgi:hypothetical protein